MVLLGEGDGVAAEALLLNLRATFPVDGDVLNLSGIAAHMLGRPEEALSFTAAAVAVILQAGLFYANHGAGSCGSGAPGRGCDGAGAITRLAPQSRCDTPQPGVGIG